jgi:hypothetical protein
MTVFSWNEWNVRHIAKHGVTPQEAEYVVRHARPPWPQEIGDDKIRVWGQTANGRHLEVMFVLPPDNEVDGMSLTPTELADFSEGNAQVAYVIHAMDLTQDMKRQYRRRKGSS